MVMLTASDLGKDGKDRYGYKVSLCSDALKIILEESLVLPEGEIERVEFDNERMVTTIYFRSERPWRNEFGEVQHPCAGKIGENGEYPEKWEVRKDD